MAISRNTRQKSIVEGASLKFKGVFTAEELYDQIKREYPNIGIATVYRNLKELSKKRILHNYSCGKSTIYSMKHMNHTHFICEKCSQKIHFDLKKLDLLKEKLPGKACHIQIDVHGTCNDCLKKKHA